MGYERIVEKIFNSNFDMKGIVSGDADKMKIELLVGDSTTFKKILNVFMKQAIQEAKKEVFDDVDQFVRKYDWWITGSKVDIAYKKLKQRHLSPSADGTSNYRKKQDSHSITKR